MAISPVDTMIAISTGPRSDLRPTAESLVVPSLVVLSVDVVEEAVTR